MIARLSRMECCLRTIRAAAKACGINEDGIHYRILNLGETIEQAIDARLEHTQGVVVHGVRYANVTAAARALGLRGPNIGVSINVRMRRRGETAEEAIDSFLRYASSYVLVHGERYRTVKAAAKACGVKVRSVLERMRERGETAEQAVDKLVACSGVRSAQYVRSKVRGAQYASLAAASRAHGVSPSAVDARMRRHKGETAEQAINVLLERSHRCVFVHKRRYPTITAAAKAHDVVASSVLARVLKKGETAEQAIDALAQSVVVHGVHYADVAMAARSYGFNINSVYRRRKKQGKTAEQVIDAFIALAQGTVVHDVRYPSITAAANAHGVQQGSVSARMRRNGETAEQAIDHLLAHRRARCIVVRNQSVAAVARAYKVNDKRVYGQIEKGKSTERAIGALLASRAKAVA